MLEPPIPYRSHICRQFLLNCRQFDHQEENCLQIRGKCLLSGIVGSTIPGFCKTAQDSRSVAYILESSIFMELTYPHKLGVAFGYFVSYQMFLLKVFKKNIFCKAKIKSLQQSLRSSSSLNRTSENKVSLTWWLWDKLVFELHKDGFPGEEVVFFQRQVLI